MVTLGSWIPRILRDKSVEKLGRVLRSFPGLGRWKMGCVKVAAFPSALNEVHKEILNARVRSVISFWAQQAACSCAVVPNCPSPRLWGGLSKMGCSGTPQGCEVNYGELNAL